MSTSDTNKFTQTLNQQPPRVQVKWRQVEGRDEFEWGWTPGIPLLALIGGLTRAQIELHSTQDWLDDSNRCPNDVKSFFLCWDNTHVCFDWFTHPDIPIDPLIGMLETIKSSVVMGLQARRVAAQNQIQLVDTRPNIERIIQKQPT